MQNKSLPFAISINNLDKEIRGIFGRFQTKNSYNLNYILASLPFSLIDLLTTAGKAIDIKDKNVTFSQIIQRDVNYERVQEMADDYLEKSSDKVVFFPPLLVSLIGFDNGVAKDRYQNATPTFVNNEFVQKWDDFFEIRLPISEQDLGHKISDGKEEHFFYNFGASLKFSSAKVKLVVIDGQHRLEALRAIRKKDIAKIIEIPICIVFPPDAVKGVKEDITVDLRELFLTVNQQQQKVSGHFLTLLDDQRLSSETIRLWGDAWKHEIDDLGFTPLQLLEWNQRHDRLESQVTRPFTITTISIVSGALKDHLFCSEQATGKILSILNLYPKKSDLELHSDAPAIDDISDNNFHSSQFLILQKSIKDHVVPALNILFRRLSPYFEQEKKLISAFAYLEKKIIDQKNGYESFKLEVLQHFRTLQDIDTSFVKDAGRDFEQHSARNENGVARFFYLNVFQQALVRLWIDLSQKLTKLGISPEISAQAIVDALNDGFVKSAAVILAYDKLYVRRTLFNGEKLLVNVRSKTSWTDLLALSLGAKNSKIAFKASLLDRDVPEDTANQAVVIIISHALRSGHLYLERFKDIVRNDLAKNYFERDLDSNLIQKLTKLDRSDKAEDQSEFDKLIEAESTIRMAKARTQLALAIGINESTLISNLT